MCTLSWIPTLGLSQLSPAAHHNIRIHAATNQSYRHLSLLFCIFRYSLSYITLNYYSRWAQFSYRTAFVSAAVTYGIVVYKAFRARSRAGSKAQGGIISLAADENVQYLGQSAISLPDASFY
jgi:hypothetical protein